MENKGNAIGWISVSDRLPSENGSYLTVQSYHGVKCIDTAHFWKFPPKHHRAGETEWTVDFSRWPERPHPQAITVTHWRELPDLPIEKSS